MRVWRLLAALMLCTTAAAARTPAPFTAGIPGNWEYIGGDEFDGTGLDPTKWNIGHWYEHDDLGVVTHTVSDGSLRLYPRLNAAGRLVSRTVNTDGKFYVPNDRAYYVEFRATLPRGPGRWPALWLFAHDDSRVPSRPELDVMETGTTPPWGDGNNPVAIKATSWTDDGMGRSTHQAVNQRGEHSRPRTVPDLTTRPHSFGAQVNPRDETVDYYVDGVRFAHHQLDSTRERLYLVISDQYDGPFNGATPADPAGTQRLAAPFSVDYVRVFVLRDRASAPGK